MEAPITPPPQINTCMHLLSSAPGPHLLPTNRDARSIAADGDSDFQCRLTRIGRLKGDDKIGDGHRWDLFPKVSFAPDSLLEQRGFELVVPLWPQKDLKAARSSEPSKPCAGTIV